MKYHYVYLLKCRGGELYTGYTVDPKKRLRLHNTGKASKFTRSRLPVKMVYLERYQSKSKALRREIGIKKMNRRMKLDLIKSA